MLAIRTDGNSSIGMGHIMRCLCIADGLKKRGEKVIFIIAKDSDDEIFVKHGYEYYRLKNSSECGWDGDELVKWMEDNNCKKILIDTYRINKYIFSAVHSAGKVIYIDDIYAFDYECDMLINYNVEAESKKYVNMRQVKKMCLGTDYFPLREEFCCEDNNDIAKEVLNVLITTGATDDRMIANRIMEILIPENNNIKFYVLIGKYYELQYIEYLKEKLQKYSNVELLTWGRNVAQMLKQCDMVIAPGSTIIFESLSMNVPCISFEFAENQHEQCTIMDEKEMVPCVGDIDNPIFKERLRSVFKDELLYTSRMYRKKKYEKCFDKRGTMRLVEAILEV